MILELLTFPVFFRVATPGASKDESCLTDFGGAYRDYMNKTPEYLGIPKS